MHNEQILVTGASGYIGGRLVPQLVAAGYRVRCLVRDPNRVRGRGWGDRVEVVAGDVLDASTLPAAFEGCAALFYLVHSMAGGEASFEDQDRVAAQNVAQAASHAGMRRILYLGGLGRRSEQLSKHLTSRHAVGDRLREGSVPVTELRAAMIIGSGSASFEMIRALVHKLPVMVCPRWVSNRTQPIAIRSVLAYLMGCLENEATAGHVYDIGGPDVLTYKEMMTRFAKLLGRKRWIFVVPVLTPRLSAYWVNMVTPVPASIAFPLIDSLKFETVCENHLIDEFVHVEPIGFEEAVTLALEKVRTHDVETRWSNASPPHSPRPGAHFDPADFPIMDRQVVQSSVPAERLFKQVSRVGGDVGWFYGDWLWEIRGWMDRLIGGAGLRRGRRDPSRVFVGDAIDFWRVEDYQPGRRLFLHAEMIVPGDAWLEFRVEPGESGSGSTLTQTAYFKPTPVLLGRLYWNMLYPLHWFIFQGMANNIVRAAEREESGVEQASGKAS